MKDVTSFVQQVISYYHDYGRDLPWRQPDANGLYDPYVILVSEIMLQQTQVGRVIPKYHQFLQAFPTVEALASATVGDVLRHWSGLGYNRRAKFLWQAAQAIVAEYDGDFPKDQKQLTTLSGVGINTAGALCAYAFNLPVVFIETNIRTVFIHHFFADRDDVHDKELVAYVQAAVDEVVRRGDSVREWYWALMDYGTHLKAEVGNISRSSKHYAKQSQFEGSRRQIRGKILKILALGSVTKTALADQITDERLQGVLQDMLAEGLIVQTKNSYQLD